MGQAAVNAPSLQQMALIAFCTDCEESCPYDPYDPVCETCGADVLPQGGSDRRQRQRLSPDELAGDAGAAPSSPIASLGGWLLSSLGGTAAGQPPPAPDPGEVRAQAQAMAAARAAFEAVHSGGDAADADADANADMDADIMDADADADAAPAEGGAERHFAALIASAFDHFSGSGDAAAGVNFTGRPPAAKKVCAGLEKAFVGERSPWLQQLSLRADSFVGEVVGTPARFGPLWPTGAPGDDAAASASALTGELVYADPPDAAAAGGLRNAAELAGRIAFVDRGGCPFVHKVRRCMQAGAAAVIVGQTSSVWPYVMTDSEKEAGDITIPSMIVRLEHAVVIRRRLASVSASAPAFTSAPASERNMQQVESKANSSSNSAPLIVTVTCRSTSSECPICQEVCVDSQCTRLPCDHFYHTACIDQWLAKTNTCPMCRLELVTDDAEYERQRQKARQSQGMLWSWYG